MGEARATRIQLCGRLTVELDGRRVEDVLPGAKGRLLLAYLVLNRDRRMTRDELLMAVYGEDASSEQHPSLSVLLSKLRSVIGHERLVGRSEVELVLPGDAFVDVEAAREGLHRAESHVAAEEWAESWGPAGVAYHVARRPLLQGEDRPWLDEWRRRLKDVHLRGLVRLLRDDPHVQSFAERELDGLLCVADEDLLSVLRTYLATGRNKSRTAQLHHVSRPALSARTVREPVP